MSVGELVRTADALTATQALRAIQTVRSVVAPDLSDDELRLFAMVATRSGLDVFARQIYAIKRKGRVTFQTSIDGYRSIASRTGLYAGQDGTLFGEPCDCGMEVNGRPFEHPRWAETWVYRQHVERPFIGHSDWHETAPSANDLEQPGGVMWRTKPRLMLAKCSEAQGLRRAFPWDGNTGQGIPTGVYTADEIAEDGPGEEVEAPATARAAIAERARLIREGSSPIVEGHFRADTDSIVEAANADLAQDGGQVTPASVNRTEFGLPDEPAEDPAASPPAEFNDLEPACAAVAPDGDIAAGAICRREPGHPGAHRDSIAAGDATVSWPADKPGKA